MLRFLASLMRRLKAGAAGCAMLIADVFDACDQGLAMAWHHAFGPEEQPDVEAMVDARVADIVEDLAVRREAKLRREYAPVGPTDLPKPKCCPPSRSVLPDVIDPRREPERYACLQALRHTTRVMFGPGAAPVPDMSVLSDAQASRLMSLGTPALAAPVHRDMLVRLGWQDVDGWWWPHRAQPKASPGMARSGAGGGPGFKFG